MLAEPAVEAPRLRQVGDLGVDQPLGQHEAMVPGEGGQCLLVDQALEDIVEFAEKRRIGCLGILLLRLPQRLAHHIVQFALVDLFVADLGQRAAPASERAGSNARAAVVRAPPAQAHGDGVVDDIVFRQLFDGVVDDDQLFQVAERGRIGFGIGQHEHQVGRPDAHHVARLQLRSLVEGDPVRAKPRQQRAHASVVDVAVGLVDHRIAPRRAGDVLVHFELQIETRVAQRSDDHVGAGPERAVDVAARIVEHEVVLVVGIRVERGLDRADVQIERIGDPVAVAVADRRTARVPARAARGVLAGRVELRRSCGVNDTGGSTSVGLIGANSRRWEREASASLGGKRLNALWKCALGSARSNLGRLVRVLDRSARDPRIGDAGLETRGPSKRKARTVGSALSCFDRRQVWAGSA